jgi:hypothetical protein
VICAKHHAPVRQVATRSVIISLAAVLFASSPIFADPPDPFSDPVTAFSKAIVPILASFEKAKVEKTWRGFFARADTQPGFKKPENEPSEDGLYLDVEVRDAAEVKEFTDHTEQNGSVMYRAIRIPAPPHQEQALIVELRYGNRVPKEVIAAIESCISQFTARSLLSKQTKKETS